MQMRLYEIWVVVWYVSDYLVSYPINVIFVYP